MRLIDADALSESIKRGAGTDLQKFFADVCVATAPTVDAAIVTRCKDCKHLCVWNRKDIYAFCPKTNIVFLPFELDTRTFSCSLGERKPSADG